MRLRPSMDVVLALSVCAALVATPVAQTGTQAGAATPQEAVAIIKKASAGNPMTALPVISPAGVKQIASDGVTGLIMVLAFSDPSDPMPGAPTPSKAELDAKKKSYAQAVALVKGVLKPYGLDTMVGKPVLSDETQKSINALLDKADTVALVTSLYGSLTKIGPLLGMKETPKGGGLPDLGDVTGYKINGDKATAQNGAETITFSRINGRWFIEPPADLGGAAPAAPAASAASPQTPGPRATAAGKDPEIVAGGIQVARVAVSNDDFSAKPFNSDNGVKLVLWVKMPAGQGLIEIDEDASVLNHFGDDKGTNLGGKFDSFPDEFKDASGGTIEIESTGQAAQGATALLADGTLAMTVATGTRKTKVANVALRNGAKFTFEKTPMEIAEVETQGDSQTFTIKLPRQVMVTIKNVVFLDAKGQPIEGRRTSSGYMNDAGEMGFSVNTTQKTVTLEFEAWQGTRTIKVPFKVKAGLGLGLQ